MNLTISVLCRNQASALKRHFYRVNFEVRTLKPFPHLAFSANYRLENASKQAGVDGELMASPDYYIESWRNGGKALTGVNRRKDNSGRNESPDVFAE